MPKRPASTPEFAIPSITAKTLMAMAERQPATGPARAQRIKPLSPAAQSSLEGKIAAKANRLHAIQGTRRQGSVIIQGRSKTEILREAAHTLAPGRPYELVGVGRDQRVVLGE